MKAAAFACLLSIGCYSPKLANPGYFCHATDNPACPDGQRCVDGRCIGGPGGPAVTGDLAFTILGDDSGSHEPVDLGHSAGSPDLASSNPPVDMAHGTVGGMTGCHGYSQCLIACGSNASCPPTCDSNATADAKSKWMTALGCGQNYCLNTSGECQLDATMTMLQDAAGYPAGSCNACLNAALAMVFGQSCSKATNPDCNPSTCTPSYQACLSSMP